MMTGRLGVPWMHSQQRQQQQPPLSLECLRCSRHLSAFSSPFSLHLNRRACPVVAKIEGATTVNSGSPTAAQLTQRFPRLGYGFSRHGTARDLVLDDIWKRSEKKLSNPHSHRWMHFSRSTPSRESGDGKEPVSASGDSEPSKEDLSADGKRSGERLFSKLNSSTMKHEPGSLSGSTLLVAGTTVGAGILAIPAVTQDAGFLPSATACVGCWLYMVLTGLLVAEVNLNTMCALGSGGVSLVSMAFRTLGNAGVRVSCGVYILYHFPVMVAYVDRCSEIITNAVGSPLLAYIFIHYALLVAYVARSSELVSTTTGSPLWLSGTLFTGALGSLCYFGSQQTINVANGLLVTGILSSFAVLVGLAVGGVEIESLLRSNFTAVPQSIPIIALSFVYQNVVPVICSDLEGDRSKIRTSIVLGTGIPLLMFIVWDAVILGSIPYDPTSGYQASADPLSTLRSTNGIVAPVVEVFSFLAVATSYIGFVLGLTDFLSDWLKLPSGEKQVLPYLLALLPPLAFAITSPNIFFSALDFAGTYGVLVLFGVIPAAMAWSERYSGTTPLPAEPPLVPGGRLTLAIVMGFAGWVITSEFLETVFK